VAFLFPGQGSQRPGMLHDLPDHRAVAATLDEARDVLDADVLDTDAALASTETIQLALLIAGVATARTLTDQDACPDMVAGHSVGAFAAAVTAGVLDFGDALRLVRLRGKLMDEAYPHGYGMGVVIGLTERRVRDLLEEATTPGAPVFVANVNAPAQITIAGADAGLDAAINLARRAGARKAERLRVPVPSHCPLLDPVAGELARTLAGTPLHTPAVPYASNRGGRALRDAEAIRYDLATSVAHPVRWHDATGLLFELGARLFVEMPPGRVLTDLATAAFPEARAIAVADAGVGSAATLIARHHRPERRVLG